ncbi:MAG TPA: hypothetical protein VMQ65_03910 [Candidatus Limnocylindria bacterium]|nr:hypothetical protein [Candidatus Limnocylindria bacterium]
MSRMRQPRLTVHREITGHRRIAGVVFAVIVAVALGLSPLAAPPALAAEPLRTKADATYTLDPDAGRVYVEIDVTQTNLQPSTAAITYYYIAFGFALQPEARNIRVSGGSAYRINATKRKGFIEAVVHVGRAVFYRQSTSFTIRYDLVGGKPRSSSPIRVGQAFATFGVWAWGDAGRSTVSVRTPAGFETTAQGDPMTAGTPASGVTLRAKPEDPARFYAIVSSENLDAYGETRLSLGPGIEIVVRAWPEDATWEETVADTLRDGVPELLDLIGLDWPVDADLDVRERHTPSLEGYAGVFLTDEHRIEVSEDLDADVIVHEASHAWFNPDLFMERWIYEGLAQEYARLVLDAIGSEDGRIAAEPGLNDPGFADLAYWTHPRVIRDQETDDAEQFGYGASHWVIHQIVEAAGVERMRETFASAEANLTAYPGAGDPETVLPNDAWMRLLDLAQPIDEPDSAAVDRALRDFVLAPIGEDQLTDRSAARDAYRDLLDAGDGWLPPWYVRKPLGEWQFDAATERMVAAAAVLGLRDEVIAAAGGLDLQAGDALERAYEGAQDGFDGPTAIAADQLQALSALSDARTKVDATPDFVTQLGLLGETPRAPYEAGRDAFESGDLGEATRLAGVAAALITGAAAVGQGRLIAVVAGILAVLLLLLTIVLLRRHRRQRGLALALAASAGASDVALLGTSVAVSSGAPAFTPSGGTLAADPGEAPPPQSASPPDDEGGPARGDSPGSL